MAIVRQARCSNSNAAAYATTPHGTERNMATACDIATLQLCNAIAYDEAIYKLVAGEDVNLWNVDWISSATLKTTLVSKIIVGITARDEIASVIQPEEVALFLSAFEDC